MKLAYGPPNRTLARELRQVHFDAASVITALKEVNLLPDTFPRDEVEVLCYALEGLKDGTAENSRVTLEYARNKIPDIRRSHFYLEDDEFDESYFEPDEGRLYRGMMLDQRLNALIASTATALDEYRSQAQAGFDDEVRAEEVLRLDQAEKIVTVTTTESAIRTTRDSVAQIRDRQLDRTERGDVLVRRLQDGTNLSLAMQSQFKSGKIVRRWFEGIATAINSLPDMIILAGKAIRVGVEIAEPLAKWWLKLQDDFIVLSAEQLRDLGKTLEAIGLKLRNIRSTDDRSVILTRSPQVIQAEVLIERMLRAGTELPTELASIAERLDLQGEIGKPLSIPRWQDLAKCTSLEFLKATHSDFELVTHAQYLPERRLRQIWLPARPINNLEPLRKFTNLMQLSLITDASDISPLGT